MNSSWPRMPIRSALLLLLVAGCSQEDWGTLEGTVQLNGSPVGPGTIMLAPVEGEQSGAVGTFGEDGVYSIMSPGRKPGAPVGEYQVTIQGGEGLGEEANPRPKTNVPPQYALAESSNLTVKIEPGENTKDFELEP